ncbi:MAG: sugar phosphate isomerase/epimerase family protein [Acidobacteriota bacterium]
MTRRTLLQSAAALAATSSLPAQPPAPKLKIAIFSKHLEFLEGEELAKSAKEIGFDGIDLAVRAKGHVEPERVRQDLPPLVAIIRQHGLEVPMLTTDIADADTPFANDILAVMTDLGIHHYRWGGYKWVAGTPLARQIEDFKPRVAKLAALNGQYQASAMYHTHSGVDLVGASIWDLHEILKGFDPKLVGVNYDIGHATVEGGLGGWIESLRITGEYLRGVAIKDFLWEKNAKGRWDVAWKPLGQGMVKFPRFFGMLREARFAGPLQLHFEYPLGGAENGRKKDLTMSVPDIFAAMKQDVTTLRGMLGAAGLV